ncbi:MAG: sulfoxide reductase heme-binding subunit YedZ [Chloroflexota bacterium]|nr:sulfoxide reductase heme-binding subunit YedZ [Chloroflexota bacterium]
MNTLQETIRKKWLWIVVNIAAVIPLLLLLWNYWADNLSADPIAYITAKTGQAAIILLGLSLACTPINTVFGFKPALTVRKSLGLYAFLYASLHLLTFVGLDYGFSLKYILDDALLEKRYILVGLAAFLILIPLAITSTKGWMKRLGRNWKRLHQLVYVAGILVVLHYVWLIKLDLTWPLIYGAILSLLLLVRVPRVRKWISSFSKKTPVAAKNPPVRKSKPISAQG